MQNGGGRRAGKLTSPTALEITRQADPITLRTESTASRLGHEKAQDDWNAYVANGGGYMFYYEGRGQPQHVDSIKFPTRIFMLRESSEDWEDARKGRTFNPGAGGALLNGGLQMKMEYFDNVNSGHKSMGGRHFRGGGGANNDPWGFDNISFMDGHVGRFSMEQSIRCSRFLSFRCLKRPGWASPCSASPGWRGGNCTPLDEPCRRKHRSPIWSLHHYATKLVRSAA